VRGFDRLTRKGRLVKTLADASETLASLPASLSSLALPDDAVASRGWDFAPEAFVFHPSKEANPLEEMHEAFERTAALAVTVDSDGKDGRKNTWIVKPSDGSKGERIFLVDSIEEIDGFLAKQGEQAAAGEAVSSWVVQRYVANPLLLQGGGRKFDMRCWVLLDKEYNIFLYRQGVLRTSAVKYDPADLSNRFAHLTNHCLATEHEEYGKFEPTNELFYADFDAELSRRFPALAATHGGSVLRGLVVPQIKRQVALSLLAVRDVLGDPSEYYSNFQLFGYDFLVDMDLRVWLCEINSSPAVAERLLPGLVRSLVACAIDPACPPVASLLKTPLLDAAAQERELAGRQEGFELIFAGGNSAQGAEFPK